MYLKLTQRETQPLPFVVTDTHLIMTVTCFDSKTLDYDKAMSYWVNDIEGPVKLLNHNVLTLWEPNDIIHVNSESSAHSVRKHNE